MEVLIIHQHFKTPVVGGAIRSYYLAKALADKNIKVKVITAHSKKGQEVFFIDGIEVQYLPIPYDNKFGILARSWAFIKFVFLSVLQARSIHADYCYCISTPLTTGLAAIWIKRLYKIPFIFEVGDLWPDAPIEMGFVKTYVFKQALYNLERNIYRKAQAIVALSPAIQERIEAKVAGKHIHLIPNMADTDYYKPELKDPKFVKLYDVEGAFVVSYMGAIGVANGLEYFLDCAKASQAANLSIRFLICGEGAMEENLKSRAGQLELRNLSFVGFKDRDGVSAIMNVTDAVFICYQSFPILETGSPNKFFDGLAAGKLILLNFGGWLRDEVAEHNCGIYLDSKNPGGFPLAIKPFVDDAELLKNYQKASRKLAGQKYSRKRISERFIDIFP